MINFSKLKTHNMEILIRWFTFQHTRLVNARLKYVAFVSAVDFLRLLFKLTVYWCADLILALIQML